MLTPQLMKAMSDAHFAAAVHVEQDPLTTSAVEAELLSRFEALLGQRDDAFVAAVDTYGFTADELHALGDATIESMSNTIALVKTLAEQDVRTPDELRAELALAAAFRNLVASGEDAFTQLTTLITQAKETTPCR